MNVTTAEPPLPQALAGSPVSLEQFLHSHDEDLYAEWVDGEVIVMSPASPRHQALVLFLSSCLNLFVQSRRLGSVYTAPLAMRLDTIPSVREPDLLFVATQHLDRLTDSHLDGPADLVVEIVSPDSLGRDRGDKFAEYEAAGIPEYWLIDPIRQRAEFYTIEDGRYHVTPLSEGLFHSTVLPGFYLRADWLWQDPLPNVATVLRELKVL